LPEPVDGEADSHDALDDTDQVTFDVTKTEADPFEYDGTDQLDALRVNDGVSVAPGCVTVTVRVTWGDPLVVVTVTVAERAVVAVLA